VRELRTAIEHAVVLCRGTNVSLRDLPASVRGATTPATPAAGPLLEQSGLTVREAERQLIIRALKECGGNRTKAAQRIGMSRRTLHRKLLAYQLEDV
jgi:two-component system response regulator HydG